MKSSLFCAVLVYAACVAVNADARPFYKTQFVENYLKDKESPVSKSVAKVIADSPVEDGKHVHENTCFVCHFGSSKKNRNEYGKALSVYLKKEDFTSEKVSADADKAKKTVLEAFMKVEAEKSAAGKTFGDLIKAGELPGGPADQKAN